MHLLKTCIICDRKLKINAGNYFICPQHPYADNGKPKHYEINNYSHYTSLEDALCDYYEKHKDEI